MTTDARQLNNPERRAIRERFVELLQSDLIGPSLGPEEMLRERPDKRYLMGILFPREAMAMHVVAEEETAAGEAGEQEGEADEVGPTDDEGYESPTDLMFQRLPASVGFSFAAEAGATLDLEVRASAGAYEKQESQPADAPNGRRRQRARTTWHRRQLPEDPRLPQAVERFTIETEGVQTRAILGGRARVHVGVRRGPRGSRIVTVSLLNERRVEADQRYDPADCLYQVSLEARPSVAVRPWPSPDRMFADPEDDELALQYRLRPALAVGHACAADWTTVEGDRLAIRTEFFPAVEVPPVTAEIPGFGEAASRGLRLQRLQSENVGKEELLSDLSAFVDSYAAWRNSLGRLHTPPEHEEARNRILGRIDEALARMHAGCALFASDEEALRCFRLANRAMLVQMAFAARAKAAERGRRPPVDPVDPNDPALSSLSWRPFQLAFLLLVVVGLWDESHPERDIVDLIWFPTGGGKTEAYLAAAAFEMIRRRLRRGAHGRETAIITRYTLRLLTQQQFQRSAHLICALETQRRADPAMLGNEPFTLGLWIGNKTSPGSFADAWAIYENELRQHVGDARNPFSLLRCPACGHAIVPPRLEEPGAVGVGIRCSSGHFEFFCPDAVCDFHDVLPVQIVDDALYRNPPTMLLATLDKFAMMAWKERAARFFGARSRGERPAAPPSLIIQDELHLISGPLGTVAGGYEACIDTAISARGGRPKIIASTATTRRAEGQGTGLYARPVKVFPPPGLNAGESFFSSPDASVPGRLYLGAMAQGHTPTFSNVLVSASVLSAVRRLGLPPEIEDGWWTLVAYHNSRRELGRSLTLARDDIPSRINAVNAPGTPGARPIREVQELSANVRGDEIANVLEALARPKTLGGAVDYLACTNMLSVGVDIDRLGLMLVLGQPKTAAEYIQATSRVGRDPKYLPGVVVCLYMPTKPRDRSHYELFRPFHEALYRYVEPASVTPYALPARDRVFHAALVSSIRMATGLGRNEHAARFDPDDPEIRRVADRLYQRMRQADPSEAAGLADAARDVEAWWQRLAVPGLRYSTRPNSVNYQALLKRFGETAHPDARETLQSMRHVDLNVRVGIRGQQPAQTQGSGRVPSGRQESR